MEVLDRATLVRSLFQVSFFQKSNCHKTQEFRARGQADTSGFEHVFMGEAKNGEVSGMHSWLRMYLLENDPKERFDYMGFLVKRGVGSFAPSLQIYKYMFSL